MLLISQAKLTLHKTQNLVEITTLNQPTIPPNLASLLLQNPNFQSRISPKHQKKHKKDQE